MGKAVIELITVEVLTPPATGNDILLGSDILLDKDGNIWMQYVLSDPEPDVWDGTQEIIGVNLTASEKWGGCGPSIT